jgi:hypothetical protein
MAFSPSWRLFKRMQDSTLAAASLIYAGAAVNGWRILPGGSALKAQRLFLWPGICLLASAAALLLLPRLRFFLRRHLWISFRTGFGQSVISVLVGVGVLAAAAALIVWQTFGAAHGGRYPAGAFSGYAAGIGLLVAQVVLVRRLERDPTLRSQIEDV